MTLYSRYKAFFAANNLLALNAVWRNAQFLGNDGCRNRLSACERIYRARKFLLLFKIIVDIIGNVAFNKNLMLQFVIQTLGEFLVSQNLVF